MSTRSTCESSTWARPRPGCNTITSTRVRHRRSSTNADGYNTRGLVAYDQRKLADAVALFEKTIEVGRTLFPRRFARKRYWKDLETRPYIRGLRNLALTRFHLTRRTASGPAYPFRVRAVVALNRLHRHGI